jgi:hypothetical protein
MATYQLPSGYLDPETQELYREVELREMSGYEEDLLQDKSKRGGGSSIDEVLSRCIVRLGDKERDKPQGQERFFMPILKDMLMTDRTFLVIRLRQLSLGDEFAFEASCPHCGHRHPRMSVSLDDLTVKEMPDPMAREWTTKLPSGAEVVFRALTGRDEVKLREVQRAKGDVLSTLLLQRIVSINGESAGMSAVKRLSVRDRDYLRGAFEEHEGGIDTKIELTCDDCGRDWQTTLPFTSSQTFFFPSGIRT